MHLMVDVAWPLLQDCSYSDTASTTTWRGQTCQASCRHHSSSVTCSWSATPSSSCWALWATAPPSALYGIYTSKAPVLSARQARLTCMYCAVVTHMSGSSPMSSCLLLFQCPPKVCCAVTDSRCRASFLSCSRFSGPSSVIEDSGKTQKPFCHYSSEQPQTTDFVGQQPANTLKQEQQCCFPDLCRE